MAESHGPKLLIAGGLVVVIAVIAGVILNQTSPPAPTDVTIDDTPSPVADGPEAPEADPAEPRDAGAERTEIATEEPVAHVGPPASYREALAGIIGRIVENDGAPVAGVTCELLGGTFDDIFVGTEQWFDEAPPALDPLMSRDTTDEEGRFHFKGVDPRALFAISIDAGGPRATIRFLDQNLYSGELRDVGDIVLDPYVTFTGRVEDYNGAPIAGARVRATDLPAIVFKLGAQHVRADGGLIGPDLRDRSGRKTRSVLEMPSRVKDLIERFPVPTTRTAEDGTFELPGIPPGLITVLVDKDEFVTLVHGPVPSGAMGGERSIGTLRLDEGEELIGRVEDTSGQPISGARVLAGPIVAMDEDVALVRPLPTTDARGSFSALGFTDEEHAVAVKVPHLADWVVVDEVFPGMDDAVIRVPAEVAVTLVALDAQGDVIPRPELVLRTFPDGPGEVPMLSPPLPMARRLTHQEDGSVTIGGLTTRPYELLVRAEGYATSKVKIEPTGADDEPRTEVRLQPSLFLEVVVQTASDQAPIEHALVHAISRRHEVIDEMPVSHSRTDGRGVALLSGLLDGTEYQIRVQHPGYATRIDTVTMPVDGLDFPLYQGGTVVGRVHSGGRPPQPKRFVAMVHDDHPIMPKMTATDDDGGFRFERVSPGEYELAVLERFADRGLLTLYEDMFSMAQPEYEADIQVAEGEETRLDIDLLNTAPDGPTAFLRGQVLVNGRAAERCQVSVGPKFQWGNNRVVRTDAEGRFDCGQVPIGDHSAVVVEVTPSELRGTSLGFGNAFYSETLKLNDGETRELLIQLRTGRLRGKVVSSDLGRPIAGAEVRVRTRGFSGQQGWVVHSGEGGGPTVSEERGSSQQTVTGSDGEFDFVSLPVGAYDLHVTAEGYVDRVTEGVDVPHGEASRQSVRLEHATIVAGRVVLPESHAIRYAWMQWHGEDDKGMTGVQLDSDTLTFESDDLGVGDYKVTVTLLEEDGEDWLEFEGVASIPTGGTRELVVQVAPAGS